jgi:replication factor C subunit 1
MVDNLKLKISDSNNEESTNKNKPDVNKDINIDLDININQNLEYDDNLWVDKYRPKTLSDFILKKEQIDTMKRWLSDFKLGKKNCKNSLLLYGPPGIGKTTIANIILKEFDYDVIEFNSSDVRNQRLIKEKVSEILGKVNVLDLMVHKHKNIGIIMDEIDGMSSGDRGGMSEMIKLMYPHKGNKKKVKNFTSKTPFICVSNTVAEKKFNDIKKNSVVVKLSEPNKFSMRQLVNKIMKKENFDIDELMINNIIKHSQFDYRRLINILEYIFSKNSEVSNKSNKNDIHNNGDRVVTKAKEKAKDENKDKDSDNVDSDSDSDSDSETEKTKYIQNLLDNFDKKNKDFTPYVSVEKILNNYSSIDNILKLYDTDKNIVSMLFYENFPEFIIKNKKETEKVKIDAISKIYKNFCLADTLDYNIYIKQRWDLYDYNCALKCCDSSNIINGMKKYSMNKFTNINFSSLLNKTSLEYLNYKNVDMINSKFNEYNDNNNYLEITAIVLSYLFGDKQQIAKGVKIMKYYDLDIDFIDKLIKLSNLSTDYKKLFNAKKKKEIRSYFDSQPIII